MRPLLLLALACLLSACTRVAFKETVGTPAPLKDIAETLEGNWQGGKTGICHVALIPGTERFVARWTEDGKDQSTEFVVTSLNDHAFILWAKDEELAANLPLRLVGGDDNALALLYPDVKEVEQLVKAGKLTGTFDEKKRAWLVGPGHWEALLAGKDFWSLDTCMTFIKIKPAQETPKPASRKATGN
ncbi:MAG: hypothetical protein ABI273_20810 [Lacunisphaera sp.]